ncbi:MAG: M48 family metallopeptidase [Bdellovibrionales bacterium]|nr:M48 family metallopeptidase [Bdellovibrionales bacterium]
MAQLRFPLPFPSRYPREGQPHQRRIRILPLLIFGLILGFYFLVNRSTVPVTGRTQLIDMSPETEIALGLQSYRQVLAQSDVVAEGKEVQLVNDVTARLVPAVREAQYAWEVHLIRSDEANAFALPGGKIAVFSGLLPIVQNEDGLACVLGHEISHVVARHGAERMAHQRLAQFAGMAVSMSVSDMDPQTRQIVYGAFGLGSQFGVLLPFSRKHESEADYLGLIYMARACFDPHEAPLVWERMAQHSHGRAPLEYLSTHPSPETRIEQFREWMPEAEKVYRENCR